MNLKNLTDMFGIRKQLWKELTMLEATVKELASHTKEQIDGLRNDMAAEFVKRDDDIMTTRTEIILARNASANALAKLEKRQKNTEEYVGEQTDSIAALILACGLREGNKFMDAIEQIKRERADLKKMIDQAKEKHEAMKKGDIDALIEPAKPEPEADLFSQAETPKRTRKEIRDEAFARNLISLDAIRVRYKATKDAVDRAVKWWEIKTQTIEGSGCKYIERADIGKIKEFITPKCAG